MAPCLSMPKPESFKRLTEKDLKYLDGQRDISETILSLLMLTDDEIYERSKIVSRITDYLKPFYPECEVIVFGSSANGFGFKGCDLDLLFVPFPGYCNLDLKKNNNETIPTIGQVLSGEFTRENLYLLSEISHLKFVRKILRYRRHYCKHILFIPAKVPILKIEFSRSPISCDFSASNRLVANNTELLWVFGKLHPHVRPLAMLLRYWAKSLGFISKTHFSSYCFTVLVIFYLQNTQPPVLPPVTYLNELAEYSRKVDGWETAICMDPEFINANTCQNTDSFSHHLTMFFDFYWNFNFVQNVVSPYFGKCLPVNDLKTSENERVRDFQVTPLSVQDPFLLSRNISRNATLKTPFKLALWIAKTLLLSENFSFEKLFDLSYYQKEMDSMFSYVMDYLPPKSISHSFQLTNDLCQKLGAVEVLDNWFEKVCQAVLDILQLGLLIECEVVDKTVWNSSAVSHPAQKRKKTCYSNCTGDLEFIMCIQCTVCFSTLCGRKNIGVPSEPDEEESAARLPSALIIDYRTSKEIVKSHINPTANELSHESLEPVLRFTCNIFRYRFSQISDVIVCFSPLTNSKKFHQVDKFLKAFVQRHVENVLRGD